MKTKLVNRYYCDHCKKSGQSSYHMRKHENGCTLNPNRVCGVCRMRGIEQHPMDELLAILPEFHGPETLSAFGAEYRISYDINIDKLRETTNDCPACTMAALRQAGIPVAAAANFNFSDRMKEIWDDLNQRKDSPCLYSRGSR